MLFIIMRQTLIVSYKFQLTLVHDLVLIISVTYDGLKSKEVLITRSVSQQEDFINTLITTYVFVLDLVK